jgi:hypothetical protein
MAESSHNRDQVERRGCKKTWCLLLVSFVACNSGEPRRDHSKSTALAPEPVAPAAPAADAAGSSASAYPGDIEKICDVVSRSSTTGMGDERMVLIANWLSANLETQEARDFLVKIQPLVGTEKADALDAEAKRVGLTGCALAAEWRNAP